MPGISIHAVDVSRGVVAAGMRVELLYDGKLVAEGALSSKGLIEVRERARTGFYEAVFHV
jgi:5-hydroxyisourate hydrolase